MGAGQQSRRGAIRLMLGAMLIGVADPVRALAEKATDVKCAIRLDRGQGLLSMRAVASSASAVSGRYRLSVLKQSAGGTSHTIQQGSFDLSPGVEKTLATTAVEASAEGHLKASLVLTTDRGRFECVLPD